MTLTSRPKSRLRLPPNKHQVKQELAQDVAHFLARGGNVEQVEQGETALVNGCFNQQRPAVVSQAQTRTLLSSEIEAIEKRKEERRHTKPYLSKPIVGLLKSGYTTTLVSPFVGCGLDSPAGILT